MNIPIHSSFYACVSQKFLQCLGRHACFNRASSVSVPQGMHAESGNFIFIADFIKVSHSCYFAGSPVRQWLKTKSFMMNSISLPLSQGFRKQRGLFTKTVFGGPACQCPCLCRYSKVLLTVGVRLSQSMESQVRPIISPVFNPVFKIEHTDRNCDCFWLLPNISADLQL